MRRDVEMLGRWGARYHAYLIKEAERDGLKASGFKSIRYTRPWLIPLFAMLVIAILFHPDERARVLIAVPLTLISLFGVGYVFSVLLYYGFRAEAQRRKAARSTGR